MLPLLSIFGQLETFLADDLYPHRYILAPLGLVMLLAVLALAYRAGLHRMAGQHRRAVVLVGAPLLVIGLIAGNYFLSPLWERTRLNEPSPLAVSQTQRVADVMAQPGLDVSSMQPAASGVPVETHRGSFSGADEFHFGRGQALLIKTAEGKHVLRFEDFSVRNGPDLYVYLSKDVGGRKVEEMLNLGRLKATDGAINYEIPASIDLAGVNSVVVWCKQFTTLFAVAPLKPV